MRRKASHATGRYLEVQQCARSRCEVASGSQEEADIIDYEDIVDSARSG